MRRPSSRPSSPAAASSRRPAGTDSDAPLIDTSAKTDEVEDDKDDEKTALQRLQAMNVPQKVQRATKGSREERAILIRDPNKMIAMAVLSSPKLTISEIEGFAQGGERRRGLPAGHRLQPRVDEELQRGGGADQKPEDTGRASR